MTNPTNLTEINDTRMKILRFEEVISRTTEELIVINSNRGNIFSREMADTLKRYNERYNQDYGLYVKIILGAIFGFAFVGLSLHDPFNAKRFLEVLFFSPALNNKIELFNYRYKYFYPFSRLITTVNYSNLLQHQQLNRFFSNSPV
jgi:hypothetical protein